MDGILAANNRAGIERQLEILKNLIRQTNEHRNTVEEMKISGDVRHEDIEAWHCEIGKKINEANREVARLRDWLSQPQNNENRAEQIRMLENFYELYKFPLIWRIVNNM